MSAEYDLEIIVQIAELARNADRMAQLLHAAIEHIPSPVTVVGANGELVRLNRAGREYAGLEFNLGVVKDWPDFHYRPDGSRYPVEELPLARSLANGEYVRGEVLRIEWGHGSTTHHEIESFPIHDESDGSLLGAMALWPEIESGGTDAG